MRKLKLEELGRIQVEDYKTLPKTPVHIVLDNIRSALNVGSAFRTADAFLIEKIHLCGITARPPHREITKTAIGATRSVDWAYVESTRSCLEELKSKRSKLIGVEQTDQSIMLQDYDWNPIQSSVLIFGNEVNGLSEDILDLLDDCIEIPQYGTKHSLNVSVSLGIVLWDFFIAGMMKTV